MCVCVLWVVSGCLGAAAHVHDCRHCVAGDGMALWRDGSGILYIVLAAVCEAGWYRFSCEGPGGGVVLNGVSRIFGREPRKRRRDVDFS